RALPYLRHAAQDQVSRAGTRGLPGIDGIVVMTVGGGRTPEQKRAVIRTAVILGAIVLAIYLYTLIRGLS
ncbi:MAG: hypothetical protein R3268_11480, partial [Acidiferrobacterales bacterium]|nr:hypothetical protein [Acidiferrobacterales bacterium]